MSQPPVPIDLELSFSPTANGATITWVAHEIGKRKSRFRSPYSGEDLALVLRALDMLQSLTMSFSAQELGRLTKLHLPHTHGAVDAQLAQAVGRRLHKGLCTDRRASEGLASLRDQLHASGRPLQLRLHFTREAANLAALPWELLWAEDETRPLLFTLAREVSYTRHIDLSEALPPLRQAHRPLRILPVVAQTGVSADDRAREDQARTKAWQELLEAGDAVLLPRVTPATVDRLSQALDKEKPDIVHIVAQGTYHEGKGYLVLDKEGGGQANTPISSLAHHFHGVCLVTLLVCRSAMVSSSGRPNVGLLTGAAPALSGAGVPLVLGMQLQLRTEAAYQLTGSFYRQLAQGQSAQKALYAARSQLYSTESDGASWFVPVLYIRSRDPGPVYLIDPATREQGTPAPLPPLFDSYLAELKARCRHLEFSGFGWGAAANGAADQQLESVFVLLHAVLSTEAEGNTGGEHGTVVKGSRPDAAFIKAGSPEERVDVLAQLADSRRMILTGGPGSGKSTMLHLLALRMALAFEAISATERAERLARIAGAGIWSQVRLPLLIDLGTFEDWLAQQPKAVSDSSLPLPPLRLLAAFVATAYKLDEPRRAQLEAMLRDGEVLVLLDGLDEVGSANWHQLREFVESLSETLPEKAPLLVTCRKHDYQQRRLTTMQWRHYEFPLLSPEAREQLVERWLSALHPDAAGRASELIAHIRNRSEELSPLTNTPLMLTMLVLSYQAHGESLPKERVLLYERCLQILIRVWRQRSSGEPTRANDAALTAHGWLGNFVPYLEMLCLLGYMAQRGRARASDQATTGLTLDLVRSSLRSYLIRRLGLHADTAEAQVSLLVSELRASGDLFLIKADGWSSEQSQLVFAHATFQEYLAGHALLMSHLALDGEADDAGRDLLSRALRVVEAGDWRAPLLFAAERLAVERSDRWILHLIDSLLGIATGERAVAVTSLVAELLAYVDHARTIATDSSLSEVWERVRSRLLALRAGLEPRSEAAAPIWRALARIGTTGSVGDDWMASIRRAKKLTINGRHYRTLSFAAARYPVTVGQFRAFVEEQQPYRSTKEANAVTLQELWGASGLDWMERQLTTGTRFVELPLNQQDEPRYRPVTFAHPELNHANQQMVFVSWYEATAYCRWLTNKARADGAGWLAPDEVIRLPTEQEWEQAAAHCNSLEMMSNIWEWCASPGDEFDARGNSRRKTEFLDDLARPGRDGFVEKQFALRGGDRLSADWPAREVAFPDRQARNTGFRVVKSKIVPS